MSFLLIASLLLAADVAPLERLDLQAVLTRALAHNLSVHVANEEQGRAQGNLWAARSNSMPQIVAGGSFTRIDHDRYSGDIITINRNELALAATASLRLFDMSNWAAWSHGRDTVDVAHQSFAEVKRSIAIGATYAYLTVLAQVRLAAVSQSAAVQAEDHFNFAHARRVGGVGNKLDELRADQDYNTSRADLEDAEAALARAREQLGMLLGCDAPIDVEDRFETPTLPSPEAAEDDQQARRSDVISASRKKGAATAIANDSWFDFLPTLVLSFQGFYQNPPEPTLPLRGWQAQALLTVPLFDGGVREGAFLERAAAARQAARTFEQVVRQARSDVRLAFSDLAHAEKGFSRAHDAAERAQGAMELAKRAYAEGSVSNLEVIDAQKAARDAQIRVVMAEDRLRRARFDVLAGAGVFP